ncbi:MAG: TetR/AcrR family transcriptional regulator [Bacteroidota bacterium]
MLTLTPTDLSPRKEEILRFAQELFSQQGYAATSMRDLAKVLDIKPASLYSHYTSKEDMLWEIALRGAEAFQAGLADLDLKQGEPKQLMQEMIASHVAVIIAHKDASAVFFKEWQRLSEPRRSAFAQLIHTYEQAFVRVIERGVAQGVFEPMPTKFTSSMLLAAINWIQHWYQAGGSMQPSEIAQQCQRFLLAGLLKL